MKNKNKNKENIIYVSELDKSKDTKDRPWNPGIARRS